MPNGAITIVTTRPISSGWISGIETACDCSSSVRMATPNSPPPPSTMPVRSALKFVGTIGRTAAHRRAPSA
jgi:hypothetical protein